MNTLDGTLLGFADPTQNVVYLGKTASPPGTETVHFRDVVVVTEVGGVRSMAPLTHIAQMTVRLGYSPACYVFVPSDALLGFYNNWTKAREESHVEPTK